MIQTPRLITYQQYTDVKNFVKQKLFPTDSGIDIESIKTVDTTDTNTTIQTSTLNSFKPNIASMSPPASPTTRSAFSWTRPFALLTTPKAQTHPDDGFTRMATSMCNVHNCLLRGMNSIYQQAPQVPPSSVPTFLKYCRLWEGALSTHHRAEEEDIFPAFDKWTGKKGVMEMNVEQHHAFEAGVTAFKAYVEACERGSKTFSGNELRSLIDDFGELLATHMADEVVQFESLRNEFPGLDCDAIVKECAAEELKKMDVSAVALFLIVHHDITYEGGAHAGFPPIPWPAMLVMKYWLYRKYSDAWEFAACDRHMKPRELKFVKD